MASCMAYSWHTYNILEVIRATLGEVHTRSRTHVYTSASRPGTYTQAPDIGPPPMGCFLLVAALIVRGGARPPPRPS